MLPENFATVDIGGGSTEVSVVQHESTVLSVSLPVGAIRVQQLLLKSNPPDPEALEKGNSFIQRTCRQLEGRRDCHPDCHKRHSADAL